MSRAALPQAESLEMPGDGGVSPSPCYRDVKVAQLQLGSAAAHMRHSTHPFPRVLRSPILCVLFFMYRS